MFTVIESHLESLPACRASSQLSLLDATRKTSRDSSLNAPTARWFTSPHRSIAPTIILSECHLYIEIRSTSEQRSNRRNNRSKSQRLRGFSCQTRVQRVRQSRVSHRPRIRAPQRVSHLPKTSLWLISPINRARITRPGACKSTRQNARVYRPIQSSIDAVNHNRTQQQNK